MKIASWNVASIRSRLNNLEEFLLQDSIDILCLQEIKCTEDTFPKKELQDIGYKAILNGQARFNGVAIIYKDTAPITQIKTSPKSLTADARFIEAKLLHNKLNLTVSCLYSPNGNPVSSAKFENKINWLKHFYKYCKMIRKEKKPVILAGDYNILPSKYDAKNIELWLEDALYSPIARKLLYKIKNLGFIDATTATTYNPSFTFWDYRQLSWQKNNGIRIDFLLMSPIIADQLVNSAIHSYVRGWEKPSDHVPVVIEIR